MARQIERLYRLTGTLRADTALSVAHGDEGITDDIVCIRDGRGRLVIPGSALAGVLRHRLGSNSLWGDDHDPGSPEPWRSDDSIWGSQVWVEDSPCVDESGDNRPAPVARRDGVGIDRHTGAAATGVLYTREVVPAGSRFDLAITIEQPLGRDGAEELLDEIVTVLHEGVQVGGATTRGLGYVVLEPEGRMTTVGKVGSRQGMLAVLRGGPMLPYTPRVRTAPARRVTVTVPWRPTGPLLVKVAANGLADAMPLTTTSPSQNNVRFVIPGSSIKGALRSHAERILRTLHPGWDRDRALEPALVLFGRIGAHDGSGRKGVLSAPDCHSREDVSGWATLLKRSSTARDRDNGIRQLVEARSAASTARAELLEHVAIDRWSGESSDGRLFSLVAPQHGDQAHPGNAWQDMRLELDLSRLTDGQADLVIALTALLARDLSAGQVPIGHGSTRGYGRLAADLAEIRFTVNATDEDPISELHNTSLEGLLGASGGELARRIRRVWADFADSRESAEPSHSEDNDAHAN